ncbi:hypothetical protein AVEN_235166-1 [Araneus ventricosus]|uniref:Uncharacterized protein n=1 Tax=Araneus ventricosus TaxID=182803 RepID=A0A4Y2H7D5_ARAVE|nr:hypothetical protein AVEN_235166-1 [Araneus ventricosus]
MKVREEGKKEEMGIKGTRKEYDMLKRLVRDSQSAEGYFVTKLLLLKRDHMMRMTPDPTFPFLNLSSDFEAETLPPWLRGPIQKQKELEVTVHVLSAENWQHGLWMHKTLMCFV